MIDNFSLLLTHGLILIACWRLLSRRNLDTDHPQEPGSFLANARRDENRAGDARDA